MPEYSRQNDNRPELGFVSLSDYLNANRGPLDAGYQQDFTQAHALGDTLQSQLGMTEQQARGYAGEHGTAATAAQAPAYDLAARSAMDAQEMGRKFADPFGRGGAGDPTSPEASFNSALESAAHGGDYSTLSGYLGGFSPTGNADALARGNQEGIADYNRPTPPNRTPEREPMPPGSFPGTPAPPSSYPPPVRRPGGR